MTVLAPDRGIVILQTTPRGRGRSALHFLGQTLAWSVIVAVGAVLVAAVFVPRLAGATPYVVETGSMRPGMPPGTMVVVKPLHPSAVRVGDVITYQLRSGEPAVVTHRVIAVGYDGAGAVHWQTQGDANDVADANWVVQEQLKGRAWYAIPYVGRVSVLLGIGERGLLVGLAALGLAGYAVVQFAGAWAERAKPTGGHRA